MRITLRHTVTTGLIALAALTTPAFAQKGGAHATGPDCGLTATADWGGDPASGLTATAVTTCEDDGRIWATLSLTNATSARVYEGRFPSDEIMVLAWAEPGQLAASLDEWLTAFTQLDNTIHLPSDTAEFPFYPAEGLTQADIDALRTEGRDMACYIQGMESAMCLLRDGDGVREIGVWLFPG